MPQDFAKHKKAPPPSDGRQWVWFFTGTVTGASVMCLALLWYFVEPSPPDPVPAAAPEQAQTSEEEEWDFYDLLSSAVVPIIGGYKKADEQPTRLVNEAQPWVLQVGSFKSPNDADRLRAELILTGMDVTTQRKQVNGEQWNQVLVGPFTATLALNQARDKLDNLGIESLPKQTSSE